MPHRHHHSLRGVWVTQTKGAVPCTHLPRQKLTPPNKDCCPRTAHHTCSHVKTQFASEQVCSISLSAMFLIGYKVKHSLTNRGWKNRPSWHKQWKVTQFLYMWMSWPGCVVHVARGGRVPLQVSRSHELSQDVFGLLGLHTVAPGSCWNHFAEAVAHMIRWARRVTSHGGSLLLTCQKVVEDSRGNTTWEGDAVGTILYIARACSECTGQQLLGFCFFVISGPISDHYNSFQHWLLS